MYVYITKGKLFQIINSAKKSLHYYKGISHCSTVVEQVPKKKKKSALYNWGGGGELDKNRNKSCSQLMW